MPNIATSISSKKADSETTSRGTSSQNPISIKTSSPNSTKQAKKRKLSQTSSSTSNSNKSSPDENENQTVHSRAEDESVTVEDSVLKSDIYKIYCQHKDFNEEKTAIKELKNFAVWHEPSREMPSEDSLKHLIGALCPLGKPSSNQIRGYVDNGVQGNLTNDQWNIYCNLDNFFTRIALIRSNGFEFWFIKDFEKGQNRSKWYRGYGCTLRAAAIPIKLKFMGMKIPFSMNKVSKTFPWVKFAIRSLSLGKWRFISWSFQENKIENPIEITAILELQHGSNRNKFVGKSTRMIKEAKHFALADFFKQIYGYTDIQKEIRIDELLRPLND